MNKSVVEEIMKENGAKVTQLREIVVNRCNTDSSFRKSLEEKLASEVQFDGDIAGRKALNFH